MYIYLNILKGNSIKLYTVQYLIIRFFMNPVFLCIFLIDIIGFSLSVYIVQFYKTTKLRTNQILNVDGENIISSES